MPHPAHSTLAVRSGFCLASWQLWPKILSPIRKPGSRDGGANCCDDTNNIIAEDGGQEETSVAGELVDRVEAGGCDTDLDLVLCGEG
jgi:hypothetical protein